MHEVKTEQTIRWPLEIMAIEIILMHSPNNGIHKIQFLFHLTDITSQPWLGPEQIADELANPPDKRMTVQPEKSRGQVSWNCLWHVRRPWAQIVNNGQLDNLGVFDIF